MVTPADLLELARELSTRGDEAAQRCAVSRAYYAAYFSCIAFASRELSFVPTGLARDHRLVRSTMRTARPDLAARLDTLRRDRNRADYDIDEPWLPVASAVACRLAAEVLAAS